MRLNIFETFGSIPGVDAEILKRMRGGGGGDGGDGEGGKGALCRPPWFAGEKNFRFQIF